MARSKSTAWFEVEMDGPAVKNLHRALTVLADKEVPFLRAALEDSARLLQREIESRAPGAIPSTTRYVGLKGTGAGTRAVISITHPGARTMEFGRRKWYASPGAGNNRPGAKRAKGSMKRGRAVFRRPGQVAKPFIGVERGDAAIGASAERVKVMLTDGIAAEWERIGSGGA